MPKALGMIRLPSRLHEGDLICGFPSRHSLDYQRSMLIFKFIEIRSIPLRQI